MLTSWMPSAMHSRLSIWPRFDAAAVWTSAVWPSRRIVPIIASAVSGLTKHDAPSAAVTPSGSASTCDTPTTRYCEYMAPPSAPTVRPRSACAASDPPAATTDAAALVADRHRLVDAAGHRGHHGGSDRCRHDRPIGGARRRGGGHVRATEQQTEIRRVDRRRIDPHDHLIVAGRRDVDVDERQLELTRGGDE